MGDDFGKRAPRFDANRGEDLQLWAMRFEALADYKEVSAVIFKDGIGDQEFDSLQPAQKAKVVKARALLLLCLGPKAERTVASHKENPHEMWKCLEERYGTKTPASRVQLQTELHQMHFNSSMTMSEFIDKVESLFNQLEAAGSPVHDSLKRPTILAMFGNADESPYGPVVSALQTLADDKMTWEAVTARLLLEYNSRNRSLADNGRTSSSRGNGKTPRALKCMAKVKCFGCKRYVHYKRDCPERKRKAKDGAVDAEMTDHKVLKSNHRRSAMLRMIVDSGASTHMATQRNLLTHPIRYIESTVSIGDGRRLKSNVKGNAFISTTNDDGKRTHYSDKFSDITKMWCFVAIKIVL